MASIRPIRDPATDDLLSPARAALVVSDDPPVQVNSIPDMDLAAKN
ncbi:hypothetical protein GCM10009624_31460 [Gordonia sinesedis]